MDIGRDHFYVTLFSNASIDLYPDNTRAVFTTHLAHPIDLGTSSSEWEVGLCEISYGGPSNEPVKPNTHVDKTMVFVYCDLVAPQFVADQNLRTLRIIHYPSIVGEHRFQNVYYLPVEKSLSGYQYLDATNGRFDGPFRSRNITRKNGTTFSARSINTRDVSSYRHYQS